MEEIADGSKAGPEPAAADPGLAAAEALAQAEHKERELHSFEIEPSQVRVGPSVLVQWVLLQYKTDRLYIFEREVLFWRPEFAPLLPFDDTIFPCCGAKELFSSGDLHRNFWSCSLVALTPTHFLYCRWSM